MVYINTYYIYIYPSLCCWDKAVKGSKYGLFICALTLSSFVSVCFASKGQLFCIRLVRLLFSCWGLFVAVLTAMGARLFGVPVGAPVFLETPMYHVLYTIYTGQSLSCTLYHVTKFRPQIFWNLPYTATSSSSNHNDPLGIRKEAVGHRKSWGHISGPSIAMLGRFQQTGGSCPTPPMVPPLKGLMVSIRWYLGFLKGQLGGAGTRGILSVWGSYLLPLSFGNSHISGRHEACSFCKALGAYRMSYRRVCRSQHQTLESGILDFAPA